MASKSILWPPTKGDAIRVRPDASLEVPDQPIIPFIEGDGTGPDIWRTSVRVLDAAVAKAFGGKKKIAWYEVYAGEKANTLYGEALWLPDETVEAITKYVVAIKGPLTTPIGGDFRSINVTLRQVMDLYCCVRPVRYFSGVPSPMKHPEKLNIVLFRENCEDVYAGIEWPAGSPEANQVIALAEALGSKIRPDSAIGLKPMSAFGSKRLIRRGIQYALSHGRRTVTLVHKGNIMKYTEGAFRGWGYELAKDEFADKVITEDEVWSRHGGEIPAGKVMLQDRVADAMFQQLMLRPDEYDVVCTPNLNGDYLSDAAAAQVGGLGIAHGGNIGDKGAVFEATHGTAPKYAGQDKVNPGSVILSGALMLEHLGWNEAAKLVIAGVEGAIAAKTVTNDFARQMPGAREVKCSEFGSAIIEHMR